MPPDLTALVSTLTTLVVAIGAALGWLYKLRSSAEVKEAHEKTLAAKDAEMASLRQQIAHLQSLSPPTLLQNQKAVLEQMEAIRLQLEKRVQDLHREVDERDRKIRALEASGNADRGELEKMRVEREKLSEKSSEFELKVGEFGQIYRKNMTIVPNLNILHDIKIEIDDINDISGTTVIDPKVLDDLIKNFKPMREITDIDLERGA
jgi:chromosome segregation ATPase